MDIETYLPPSQLADLVGITPKRLEIRRQRERLALEAGENIEALPIKQPENGKHARFDFSDALALAAVVELERCGFDFTKAVSFVKNSRMSGFLGHDQSAGDFYVCGYTDAGGVTHHVFGSMRDVARCLPLDRVVSITLNISEIARSLEHKLRTQGIERSGHRLFQREAML